MPPILRKRLLALFLAFCSLSTLAHAEPTAADRERARALAAQGFAALQRQDFATAEKSLREADQLFHAPSLVVDHARALVGLGRLVEAHERYALVVREGVALGAPTPWRKALTLAKAELALLEPRLAWLTISVPGVRAPAVKLDNRLLPQAVLGVRRATNPGRHTIVARGPHFLPKAEEVSLQEGETKSVELVLEADPDAATAELDRQPEIVVVQREALTKAPDRTLAVVLLAAGAVGVATGAVTGALALQQRSKLNETCSGSVCQPRDSDEYAQMRQHLNRYQGWGTASGVAFGLGLGAAAAGIALFIFDRPTETDAKVSARSRQRVEVGIASVRITRSF